jgi:photosystem II stability/assembly factor-like uncharacterized protein
MTEDGAKSWRAIYEDSIILLDSVQFVDSQHGFAGGGWGGNPPELYQPTEALLATDDGGATWQLRYRHDSALSGHPITRLRFSSSTIG